jgi:hypothetical protein
MKFRNPETVNNIGGLQLNFDRYTLRYMDFICSRDSLVWVFDFPPPAPAYYLDL